MSKKAAHVNQHILPFIEDSQYAMMFHSDNITKAKYGALYEMGELLLKRKIEVGEYVLNEEFLTSYIDKAKYKIIDKFVDRKTGEIIESKILSLGRQDFIKEMRSVFNDGVISSCFDYQLYGSVYDSMMQKVEAIQKHFRTYVTVYDKDDCYKRNSKKHKKGDPKVYTSYDKPLCICINYLVWARNIDAIEYARGQLATNDKLASKKKKKYEAVVYCCDKFGAKRLYDLAKLHRKNIINRYVKRSFNFTSVSFSGRSRKSNIVAKNKNKHSKIDAFIELSGFKKYETLCIPVKFQKKYHGTLADYKKKTPDYEYTVTFDKYHKEVTVILSKKDKRYKPVVNEYTEDNTVGCDVNMKHNMLALSDYTTVNHNQKLIDEFTKECNKTDELKKKDKNYQPGKRRQRKSETLKRKYEEFENYQIAQLCKRLKEEGKTHIVLEELTGSFGKSYVYMDEHDKINFNRVVGFVGLSSIKEKIEHIAPRYGIAVSFVQSHYTSKMCSVCGEIDDDNRLCQEDFDCVTCHHTDNADFNAAVNIRNRVVIRFLRDKLLKQRSDGSFKPKDKMYKDDIKKVLLQFRDILHQNAGRDYV